VTRFPHRKLPRCQVDRIIPISGAANRNHRFGGKSFPPASVASVGNAVEHERIVAAANWRRAEADQEAAASALARAMRRRAFIPSAAAAVPLAAHKPE
jgi:hypothetical protein